MRLFGRKNRDGVRDDNLLRKVAIRLLGSRDSVRDDLLRKMGRAGVCAEIGVFRGDFSELEPRRTAA